MKEFEIVKFKLNVKISPFEDKVWLNQEEMSILYKTNIYDRFIIIDQKELYHLGTSIKDVGKKVFVINKMDFSFISNLLSNI